MTGGPSPLVSPLGSVEIPKSTLLFDLVYSPRETPYLQTAKYGQAPSIGGISMLVYQGANAFYIWTGKTAPLEILFAAANAAMEQRS